MNDLIIDATTSKIFLTLIKNNKNIYTSKYENSKNNFDKLVILIQDLLDKSKMLTKNLNRIYVNRGPGSFAGVRGSISVAKGFHVSENISCTFSPYIMFSVYFRAQAKCCLLNPAFKTKVERKI